jgi:hypothetical protein
MQAMSLFEDLYEEPTIDYIETLLVIVSKPFIHDRKTQFFFTSLTSTLAKLEIGILFNSAQ